MTLAATYREPGGSVTALVADIDVMTACGITREHVWWCECGTRVDGRGRRVGPRDVCQHLRTYGSAPRSVVP